jgi:hypothetical protein
MLAHQEFQRELVIGVLNLFSSKPSAADRAGIDTIIYLLEFYLNVLLILCVPYFKYSIFKSLII